MSVRATGVALLLAALPALGGEQELPVYPGVPHTRIGRDLVIGGAYYRMAYFVTPDPMRKVGRHFLQEWERLGHPTSTDGAFEEEGVVSAFQTREGLLRSVILRRHLGATVGIVTLRDLWARPPAPELAGLVRLEGALYSQDALAREEPGTVLQRSTLVAQGLAAAREQVVGQLGAAGFSLEGERLLEEEGQRRLVLEHAAPQGQAVTALVELAPALTAMSQTLAPSGPVDGVPGRGASPEEPGRVPPGKGEGR